MLRPICLGTHVWEPLFGNPCLGFHTFFDMVEDNWNTEQKAYYIFEELYVPRSSYGLSIKNLKAAVGEDVKLTLLSTSSCYPGGGSITPDLNITTLTAIDPIAGSVSCEGSASLERKRGAILPQLSNIVFVPKVHHYVHLRM